jgi:hypothetical protein
VVFQFVDSHVLFKTGTTTTGAYRPSGFTTGEIASSKHMVGEVGFRVGLDSAGKREICASGIGTSVV